MEIDLLKKALDKITEKLSSKHTKYHVSLKEREDLSKGLNNAFLKEPSNTIALLKTNHFFVLKSLWPDLSLELLEKIFIEIPVLNACYSSSNAHNGKPILRENSLQELQNILSEVKPKEISRLEIGAVMYYLKYANKNLENSTFTELTKYPILASKLMTTIKDGFGIGVIQKELFSTTAHTLLRSINSKSIYTTNASKQELFKDLSNILLKEPEEVVNPYKLEFLTSALTIKSLQFLGRTLLIHQENDPEIFALKISKNSQDKQALIREYEMVKFLGDYKSDIGLKSTLPTALQIVQIQHKNLEEFLKSYKLDKVFGQDKLIAPQDTYTVYRYRAKEDYFTYLYDIKEDDKFYKAVENSLHDLLIMFCDYGVIFNQLVPLFHSIPDERDRADNGRYIVLTNIIKNFSNIRELDKSNSEGNLYPKGTGRLPEFQKALEFPNIRASGLADLGDCIFIGQISDVSGKDWYESISCNLVRPIFNEETKKWGSRNSIFKSWGDKTDLVLIANFLAEYIFVITLLSGERILNTKDENNVLLPVTWLKVVDSVIEATTKAIISITDFNKDEVNDFFSKVINKTILARQMKFYMTNEYTKYIEKPKEFPKLPIDLYDADTEVKVSYSIKDRKKYWVEGKGFAELKTPDLGAPYSHLPLTELIKFVHLPPLFILSYKHQQLYKNHPEPKILYTPKLLSKPKLVDNENKTEINPNVIEPIVNLVGLGYKEQMVEPIDGMRAASRNVKSIEPIYQKLSNIASSKDNNNKQQKCSELLSELSQEERISVICQVLDMGDMTFKEYFLAMGPLRSLSVSSLEDLVSRDSFKKIFKSCTGMDSTVQLVCSFLDCYFHYSKDEKVAFHSISVIKNNLLKLNLNIVHLVMILQIYPEAERLSIIQSIKNIDNNYYDTKFFTTLIEMIPLCQRLEALKSDSLQKIVVKIFNEDSKINKGAFLEHILKLLPNQTEQKAFINSEISYESPTSNCSKKVKKSEKLINLCKQELYYIYQIFKLTESPIDQLGDPNNLQDLSLLLGETE